MKKIVVLVLIIFLLTGCSTIKKSIKSNRIKEEYSLVSTDDRLVFQNGDNYEIVYFDENKITKVESAIKFESKEAANEYYLNEKYGNNNEIEVVNDTFILKQTDDYFEDYKDLSKGELIEYMSNANFIKK